jgi:serine/threonine protein kinase
VYSLGIVLYEMVTGHPPFTGDNPVAIAYKHVREEPVPPRQANPSIPPAFEAIVLQAMAKDRDNRYASAEDLRADLLRFRHGRAVVAAPYQPPPPDMTVVQARYADDRPTGTTVLPVTAAPPEARPPRTWIYVVLLFVLLAALGVLLFFLGKNLGLFGGNNTATSTVSVPTLVGLDKTTAESKLKDAGLQFTEAPQPNDTTAAGTVFAQDPAAGSLLQRGKTVVLKISTGATLASMPSVVGKRWTRPRRSSRARASRWRPPSSSPVPRPR